MPERDDAGSDRDPAASPTPVDQTTGDDIESEDLAETNRSAPSGLTGRRRALGAVALGFLAAACRNPEEEVTSSSPASTPSPVDAGDPLATVEASGSTAPIQVDLTGQAQVPPTPAPNATGPELEQVY
ncbi:MAG: hypothetical protein AAFO29_10800, partial [Actinomycetota bacterium]